MEDAAVSVRVRAVLGGVVLSMLAALAAFGEDPAQVDGLSAEAWKRAMSLSDEQRYDASLEVIRKALERDPQSTDLRWLEAGVLGWSGRCAEAVARYERLVADHPDLADDVRVELGTQRLWAGDPRGALADAETALTHDPSDAKAGRLRALALAHSDRYEASLAAYDGLLAESPGDADLALDRAMVLGWMGRNAEAVAAYQEILDAHPDETRARIGLAQNENWRGNHRKAADMFEGLLADSPEDPEVLRGLAFADYWADRPEAARTALDRLIAVRPEDREGRQLSTLLRFEERPTLTGGYEVSDDSDDLRVESTTLDYRHPLPRRTALLALVREDRAEDPGGTENPLRIGAGLEKRWDAWKVRVRVFHFDPRHDRGARGLGDASCSYRPSGRLQVDFGFEVEPVLTRVALAQDIRSTNGDAAVAWKPIDRVTLNGGVQHRDYNDGNQAWLASAGVRWNVPSRRKSRLDLLFGVELLHTDEDLNDGYYDPARYLEFGPGAEWTREFRNRVSLGLRAHAGYQQEKGSSGDPFYKAGAVAEIPLGRAWRLGLEVWRSNSNLSSQSGFEQTRGSLYLTTAF